MTKNPLERAARTISRRCPLGLGHLAWAAGLFVLLTANAVGGQAGRHLDLVHRSILHHGFDSLERSTVTLRLASKSGAFDLLIRAGDVFEYVVEENKADAARRVRVTNDTVQEWRGGTALELSSSTRQRAVDFAAARVYFVFLPYRLEDPSARHEDLGLERWGRRSLHKIKVTFEADTSSSASSEFLYWFNPKSAELEQFAYSFADGLRFRKLINRRRVGGLLIADQENYARDDAGLNIDWITPATAAEMELLSIVTIENLKVSPR